MTCIIAHTDGWMVADRRQTFTDSLIGPYETNKIKRCAGLLVASSGNGVFQDLISEAIDGLCGATALKAAATVLREKGNQIGGHALALVQGDSVYEITSAGSLCRIAASYWAIGSGYPFALGFLRGAERCKSGAFGEAVNIEDAISAIEFASTRVNDVGDGCQVERFE